MSTPRRSSRIQAKEEEKLSRSESLKSKRKSLGRKPLKRARNAVLSSSSEEEEVQRVSSSEGEGDIDPSDLISPVKKYRKPNNFLKV